MRIVPDLRVLFQIAFLLAAAICAVAQHPASQEVSESDGVPVLLKHLPNYEEVRSKALFTADKPALGQAVGNQPVLDLVEFTPGTEAVTAPYPAGRLVIIEFTNPQASVEADGKIQDFLARTPQPSVAYRRIGNYNAFVFAASDPTAAAALLDQVKYEKSIHWLGEDPYLIQKLERYLIGTSRDIMLATVLFIVFGLGGALLTGIIAGFLFFRARDQKRATRTAFSDAGGLTRLNLDELSE